MTVEIKGASDAAATLYKLSEWLLTKDDDGEEFRVRHAVINCSDDNPQNWDFCPRCVVLWSRKKAEEFCPQIKTQKMKGKHFFK